MKNSTLLNSNRKLYVDPAGRSSFNPESLGGATFSHVGGAKTTMGSLDDIPGAGGLSDSIDENKGTVKSGLINHIKTDIGHGSDFLSSMGSILGGKKGSDAVEITGKSIGAVEELKGAGNQLLEGLGRGSKTFGAAKVGGYMLGTAMLADMLNPFDKD